MIALGIVAVVTIILSQVFWIRKGLVINQSNFESAVTITLEQIAARIEIANHGTKVTDSPVIRISPHAYLVDIDEPIDLNQLDYLIRSEFANPFHKVDFVYQVYESSRDDLVFEETVTAETETGTVVYPTNLPKLTESTYYFKINFPQRPIVSSVMLFVWATSIIALSVVLAFFGYSIDVILRQQRLSKFQKNFINNLAHEFKTPISTIGIAAEVLSEPDIADDPVRLKGYAAIIKNENNRLTGQVSKILELANLEVDEITLNLETFHVLPVMEEIVQSFSVRVNEQGGTLITEYSTSRDEVTADMVHFQNVINTVLDNALKYNDKVPEITIAVGRDQGGLFISIADNGIGIPKEYHRKIFEKFFRVPTGDVHNVKGYGLGLNYVKMIAKAHAWSLRVDSQINKGSIFTIIIP